METYKANGVNGKGLFYRSLNSKTMYLIDNRVKCRMTIPDHYMQNGHSKKGFRNDAWLDKPIKFHVTSSPIGASDSGEIVKICHRDHQQFGCGKEDVNYNGLQPTVLFYLD